MHHYRKTRRKYARANLNDVKIGLACALCDALDESNIIEQTTSMIVVKNRVAYDLFEDLQTTGEHLMIVPKRHVEQLSEFSEAEKNDMFDLLAKYEDQGFSIYARAKTNVNRSQPHQHTHLIRTGSKKARVMIYCRKPYYLRIV